MAAVTIFNSPLLSFRVLLRLAGATVMEGVRVLKRHSVLIALVLGVLAGVYYTEGPHQQVSSP